MSQYKVLPSYTDLTTLTDDLHQAGPVLCHAQVGGDRLVDLDHDLQVQTFIHHRVVEELFEIDSSEKSQLRKGHLFCCHIFIFKQLC